MSPTFLSTFTKYSTNIIACIGLVLASSQTHANPLNFTLNDSPDIMSSFIDVDYSAGSGTLTMSGFATQLFNGSTTYNISNGLFSLSANVNTSGVFSSGSLYIDGSVTTLGFNSGNLLTGNLLALGFDTSTTSNSQILEFKFDALSGDAASLYNGTGGIIVGFSGFQGDWSNDWNNTMGFQGFGTAVSDAGVVVVPEPSALLLLSAGIGLLGISRRFRANA